MPTKFVTNPRRPAAKKSRVPMRRNYASASTADNYLRDLRPAQVAQMVREGSLAITHADIGNDYHTVTLFEDGAGGNRKRVEAKWFVPGEEWYDLSLGLRDGKVDPSTADLFLGPSGWDKREREEQTRAAAKRKGIDIDASRHYFNNPRRPARKSASHVAPMGKLVVVLSAVPNPDFDRRSWEATVSIQPKEKVVADFREASRAVQKFIAENNLGGGNWPGGPVYDDTGTQVAYISYNGRVWEPDGNTEKKNPRRPLPSLSRSEKKAYIDLVVVGNRRNPRRKNPSSIEELYAAYKTANDAADEAYDEYFVAREAANDAHANETDASLVGSASQRARLADASRAARSHEHATRYAFNRATEAANAAYDAYTAAAKKTKANPRRKNPPKGFRIAGPAVKTLADGLRISKADAQKLKDMMDTGAPRILQTADKMMNGNGVERISGMGGGLMYVNMGDTYDTTLIYDYKTNRFVVSSWGDIVERQPRRFAD